MLTSIGKVSRNWAVWTLHLLQRPDRDCQGRGKDFALRCPLTAPSISSHIPEVRGRMLQDGGPQEPPAFAGKALALLMLPAMLLQGWKPLAHQNPSSSSMLLSPPRTWPWSAGSPCIAAQPCSPLVQACPSRNSRDTPLVRHLLLISHFFLCIK